MWGSHEWKYSSCQHLASQVLVTLVTLWYLWRAFFLFFMYFVWFYYCFQREGRVSLSKPQQNQKFYITSFKTSEQFCAIGINPHFIGEELGHWRFKLFHKKTHQNRRAEFYFKFHVLSNLPLIPHHQLSLDNIWNKRTQLKNKDKEWFLCHLALLPHRQALSTSALIDHYVQKQTSIIHSVSSEQARWITLSRYTHISEGHV